MTEQELFHTLRGKLSEIIEANGLGRESVQIVSRALTAEEAIGNTARRDYPILTGKESMLQAECGGCIGQAFTDAPAAFRGTLGDVLALDPAGDPHARGLFVATLNAVMCRLGLAGSSVHCKNDGPEKCAVEAASFLRERYGAPKIALIGYQPALLARLAGEFPLRVLDLNPDNVGQVRSGVRVGHGFDDLEEALAWADVVLCTGSTLCNGSLVRYLNLDKDVWFYGTTLAGAAPILGLNRLCFSEQV